jgi:hypothetical protein
MIRSTNDFGLGESVAHLRAAAKRSASGVLAEPAASGPVSESRVRLQRVIPLGLMCSRCGPAISMAAPLFFRIVDGIRASDPRLPDALDNPPAGVVSVEVCAASGDPPNVECPHRIHAWYIPGKSPIRVSSVHRRILTDTRTGLRACADTPPQYTRA